MPLLTQYASFFVSPFGEKTVCDELNTFLKSNRIVNVEKRLMDGERAGFFWSSTEGSIKAIAALPGVGEAMKGFLQEQFQGSGRYCFFW